MAAVVLVELAAAAPLADGSLLGEHLVVSSAGTSGWHAGEPMDPRARSALERRGYADRGHRAQAFDSAWFATTDLVVCMDRGHQQTLLGLARKQCRRRPVRGAPGHVAGVRPPCRGGGRRSGSLLRRRRRLRDLPRPWWSPAAGAWWPPGRPCWAVEMEAGRRRSRAGRRRSSGRRYLANRSIRPSR